MPTTRRTTCDDETTDALRALGRQRLHASADAARYEDGLERDAWLADPFTYGVARRFGVEDVVEHVAAYVWRA